MFFLITLFWVDWKIFVENLSEVPLTLYLPVGGGGANLPPHFYFIVYLKNFPSQNMMKLYVNSYILYSWRLSKFDLAKKLSKRAYVVDIYIAWVENCKNQDFNFKILTGILEGFFIK